MNRKALMRIAKPLLGILLLGLLISQVNFGELWPLLQQGDGRLVAASMVSFTASLCLFQALRLHVLVAHYTGGLRRSMRLFFVGAFFNNLLPSNVGGDAVRLLYLRRMKDGGWAGPLSLLLLHRLSGIAVMLLFFAAYVVIEGARLTELADRAGLHVQGPTALLWGALSFSGLLGIAGALLARRTALGKRVMGKVLGALRTAHGALSELSGPSLLSLVVLTVLFHGARMIGFYYAVRFFGQSVALWDLIPVLTFTAVVAMVPITVGGLGLVEGSVGVGLGLFGVSPSAAVATALINRAVMILVAIVGGIVYASDRDELKAAQDELRPLEEGS